MLKNFNRVGLLLILICFFMTGCALLKLKQDLQGAELFTVLVGRVTSHTPVEGPIVVAAYTTKFGKRTIAHYSVLHDFGEYELLVPKGNYRVFAFNDKNSNLICDPGEPAGQYGKPKVIAAPVGGVVPNNNIVLLASPKAIDWPLGRAVSPVRPPKLYSRLAGEIVDLDDERFAEERGSQGFWEPISFFKSYGGNIYFLEPYDPQKIPILFIHGAGGTPKGWKYFVDNLDRTRFQPWFFYYPSGLRIRAMSHLLLWKLLNLRIKHKFDTIHITAHSMGGLVARSFIVDHGNEFPFVKLFVSLATPWGGDKMAEYGVRQSPAVIPCWIDMQPEGDFMQSIYRAKMPDTVKFYMFYGHRGGRNPFRSNNDGTITLSSLLDRRPQAEAKMSYAFDEDHASIIYSKEVVDQYNAILQSVDTNQRGAGPVSGGYFKLNFTYDYPGDDARPWPRLFLRSVDDKQKVTEIALRPEDSGTVLGPIPYGDYSALLYADGVKTQKTWTTISIERDHTNALSFAFVPDGTISGYIANAIKPENKMAGMPEWRVLPRRNKVDLQSITLTGNGIRRTIPLFEGEKFKMEKMEVSRTDYCYNGYLRIFGLAEGQYELVITPRGHKTIVDTIVVTPGREHSTRFYELTPEN